MNIPSDVRKMEATALFSILFIFLSLFIFLIYYFRLEINVSKSAHPPPPPGGWGWPLIGESLEFMSNGRKGEPQKFLFQRMTKYSSTIFKTYLFGERMVVMCGDKANKFLFSNDRKLVRGWWPTTLNKIFPTSTQISTSSDESFKVREMLLPNFLNPESLRQYVGTMDIVTQRHFASSWENKEVVHAHSLVKKLTLALGCRMSFSVDDDLPTFAETFDVLISGLLSISIDLPGTRFRRAIKASNHLRKLMRQIIVQRKIDMAASKALPVDILSHMLSALDKNGKYMSELEIVDKILGLMVGAYEPTSSACVSIVMYLAELPHIYDGVYKEQMEIAKSKGPGELLSWDDIQKMRYSWKVVCEVLRLSPPLQGAFREAMVDFTYNGFSVPKGRKVYWSANATHLNPDFFKDPMKFDPSRFEGSGPPPYTFVPFGGGPRMCPGQEYARAEILVFIHHLVKRFRWEKIIADERIVINPVPAPAHGLPIRLFVH